MAKRGYKVQENDVQMAPPNPHCTRCNSDRFTIVLQDHYGLIAVLGWCACLNGQEVRMFYREWQALPLSDPAYNDAPRQPVEVIQYGSVRVAYSPRAICERCGFPVLFTERKRQGSRLWETGDGLCGCAKASYEDINAKWLTVREDMPGLIAALRANDRQESGKMVPMAETLKSGVSVGVSRERVVIPAQGVENASEGLFGGQNTPSGTHLEGNTAPDGQDEEWGMF